LAPKQDSFMVCRGKKVASSSAAGSKAWMTALIGGLRVAARAGRSRVQMERLVALALGVLDVA
jgi:TetR/AcrR family transcriptional repressor of nem operon